MTDERTFQEILTRRIDRRSLLAGVGASAMLFACKTTPSLRRPDAATQPTTSTDVGPSTLTFEEIPHVRDATHHVAPGYDAQVVIRWGDALESNAPEFDAFRQTAAAQEKQFGYNNDFLAFLPLPLGSSSSTRGLLCANHEYTCPYLMFPGSPSSAELGPEQVEIDMSAHGHTIVEIERTEGGWRLVRDSPFNRRITMRTTRMGIGGPARGHELLKTSADPQGVEVIGTLSNCAGGTTPWGTVLIAEENFDDYFSNAVLDDTPQGQRLKRYTFPATRQSAWGVHQPRFDLAQEPNEANRFGWIVEIDPYDPERAPIKRTALGRMKHEGATTVINHDGRVVVYTGDDEQFEYLYRFVTSGRFDPIDRDANRDLLDAGTLSVAKFDESGSMRWLPLVHGDGPLSEANGFRDQGDVVIMARRAADLVGATPMDRPEDVEVHPHTGLAYVMLTNNTKRTTPNAANPRPANRHGHIVELLPPAAPDGSRDHAAERYDWGFFLIAGDPNSDEGATYHPGTTRHGWFSCPDNLAFDPAGHMWIATDQGSAQAEHGIADGLYGADTQGPGRALPRQLFAAPIDAEVCGPCFTPDGQTLFVSVQHPGERSQFEDPSTRWPDFAEDVPPRPSVVAITRRGGGPIGS
ncbi:MAG: PhoX family phosphatase [Myxococcota bacterium]